MSVLVDALRRARRKTRVRRQRHDPHTAPYHGVRVAGRPAGGEIAHSGVSANRREHLPGRTSIELQAGLCRIVEVAAPRRSAHGDVRVRQFVTNLGVDLESPNFSGALRRMRQQQKLPRRAVVTLWGLRSMHRCLRVLAADSADLGAIAAAQVKEEIALLEADGSRATRAVMSRGHATSHGQVAREVSLTAASEQQIVRRLEPIIRAGYRVDRVLTPAMALASLARGRADAIPGASFMYVALATRATCVAVVKDGLLLMARELPWGHARALHAQPDDGNESFRETLASELRRSLLYARQSFRTSVDAVVLCGDFVGLRTLTGPLTAALNVPVQTLDSMTGVDVESVPDPAAAFRADIAALRLAVAAGVEHEPSASLISRPAGEGHRRAFQAAAAAAAIVVCVAAIVWYVARRPSSSPPAPVLRSAALNAGVASTAPVGLQVQPSARLETAATAPSETAGMSGGRSPAAVESAALTHSDGEGIVVDSIFSLSDRRLAVVNGRLAAIGDRIGIFVIVDIQPAAIVVESPDVRRRTIAVRLPSVRSEGP